MSGDGVDRPGGWVPGIGWVALFTEMPEGTCYVNRLGGSEGVEDKRSIRGADQRFPAIITRWPDGSTPEAPVVQETECAVCEETVLFVRHDADAALAVIPEAPAATGTCAACGGPISVSLTDGANGGKSVTILPAPAPPEADSAAEIYRVRQPEGYAERPVGNHRVIEPYFDREGRAIELLCMGDGSVRWELVGRDGEVLEPAPTPGEGEAP